MVAIDDTIEDEQGTLHIERIISGGDGLARRADGCVVFVPRTAPGDSVAVEYTEQHQQWRRARAVRIIEAGPDRQEPPCPVYDRCGGCHLQHLRYKAQLAAKASIVIDCLRRLGGREITELEVVPSPREFAYRNRVSMVARHAGSGIAAGYHAFDDPDDVVDVTACPLAEDAINDAWTAVRGALEGVESAPADRWQVRLTLRANVDGRVALTVEGDCEGRVAARLAAVDTLDAVWQVDARGRITGGAGAEHLDERWGDYDIPLAGGAFVQVNREAAARMDAYVVEQCHVSVGDRVVDAYCGFGLRALEVARLGGVAAGIDIDRSSVTVAGRLAKRSGMSARFKVAAVERALPSHLPADVVILNPPRRGVHRRAIEALAKSPPARIVYVSCNPATLARDLKGLGAGFRLDACRAFDLFPQTAHVETVATLVRDV